MAKYNSDIHHRRSIRLKRYDYSQPELYFITICTQNRSKLLGDIKNSKIILNDAGIMVHRIWNGIPNDFRNIQLHEFVIMANHIHGIIKITTVGADSISAKDTGAEIDSAPTPAIPEIVQSFKRHTTIEYIKMVKLNIVPPFEKRIWQRNYYEHIIRNEKSYYQIAEYIRNNPLKWQEDKYYV
jgi:REP element-mobilizing transposase RayT